MGYPLGEHMALQFSVLNSAFLGLCMSFHSPNRCSLSQEHFPLSVLHSKKLCVSFPFAKCVLLAPETISALGSALQEGVREFSVRQTLLLASGTISALDSVFQEAVHEFSVRQMCLLIISIPSLSWLAYSSLTELFSSSY
jgi:hypothetical protein